MHKSENRGCERRRECRPLDRQEWMQIPRRSESARGGRLRCRDRTAAAVQARSAVEIRPIRFKPQSPFALQPGGELQLGEKRRRHAGPPAYSESSRSFSAACRNSTSSTSAAFRLLNLSGRYSHSRRNISSSCAIIRRSSVERPSDCERIFSISRRALSLGFHTAAFESARRNFRVGRRRAGARWR